MLKASRDDEVAARGVGRRHRQASGSPPSAASAFLVGMGGGALRPLPRQVLTVDTFYWASPSSPCRCWASAALASLSGAVVGVLIVTLVVEVLCLFEAGMHRRRQQVRPAARRPGDRARRHHGADPAVPSCRPSPRAARCLGPSSCEAPSQRGTRRTGPTGRIARDDPRPTESPFPRQVDSAVPHILADTSFPACGEVGQPNARDWVARTRYSPAAAATLSASSIRGRGGIQPSCAIDRRPDRSKPPCRG